MDLQASNARLQEENYEISVVRTEVVFLALKFGPWLWKESARFLDHHGLDNEILRSLYFLSIIILCKEIIVYIFAFDHRFGDKEVRRRLFWNRIKKGCCMCASGVLATAVTLYLRRVGIPYSDLYLYPFFVPVSIYKKFFQRLFANHVFNSPPPSLDTDQATATDVHGIRYEYAMRMVVALAYLGIFNYITYKSDMYLTIGFKERAIAPGLYVFDFIFVFLEFFRDTVMTLGADEKAGDGAFIEPSPRPSCHNFLLMATTLSTSREADNLMHSSLLCRDHMKKD